MGFALLFSGQGSQHAQMLRWVSSGPLIQSTHAALGVSDWRQAIDNPEWGSRNENAQVFLTGIALAAWAVLAPRLPAPAAIAGYSVGELAAFAAAGVFDPVDAISLARVRAAAMDRCAAIAPGGMLAVMGAHQEQVEEICVRLHLALAIRNAPSTFVLGGPDPALEDATALLSGAGARCVRLNVQLASHTPWMRAAAVEFAAALSRVRLSSPQSPLFGSTGNRIVDANAASEALAAQIANTVLWDQCLESVHARNVGCVLEVGPGAALASMWNQRFPEIPARSADEFHDAGAIIEWIERRAA